MLIGGGYAGYLVAGGGIGGSGRLPGYGFITGVGTGAGGGGGGVTPPVWARMFCKAAGLSVAISACSWLFGITGVGCVAMGKGTFGCIRVGDIDESRVAMKTPKMQL